MNKSINILIAIPGRKQACQHCTSTQHWTNYCNSPHLYTSQQETPTLLHSMSTTTGNTSAPQPDTLSFKGNTDTATTTQTTTAPHSKTWQWTQIKKETG